MSVEVEPTLAEILSLVLERPVAPGELVRREDEAKWDSLKHLEIIMAVESAFGASFTADEMAEVRSSEDLLWKVRDGG